MHKIAAGLACLSLVAAPVVARPLPGSSDKAPIRLHFRRGASSIALTGHFTRQHPDTYYVVRARAGQHMKVQAESRTAEIYPLVLVFSPTGETNGDKNNRFDEKLKRSGDYTIRVFVNQMASNRANGAFLLHVTIR